MAGRHYIDEVGTDVIVETYSDVTTATVMFLRVKKPSGITVDWITIPTNEGITKVKYVTVAGDLNEHGTYTFQVYLEFPDWKGFGETGSFKIYKQFEM